MGTLVLYGDSPGIFGKGVNRYQDPLVTIIGTGPTMHVCQVCLPLLIYSPGDNFTSWKMFPGGFVKGVTLLTRKPPLYKFFFQQGKELGRALAGGTLEQSIDTTVTSWVIGGVVHLL